MAPLVVDCYLTKPQPKKHRPLPATVVFTGRREAPGRDLLRRSPMKAGRPKLAQASMYECSRCGDEYTFAAGDDEMLFTIHRLLHLAADWRLPAAGGGPLAQPGGAAAGGREKQGGGGRGGGEPEGAPFL